MRRWLRFLREGRRYRREVESAHEVLNHLKIEARAPDNFEGTEWSELTLVERIWALGEEMKDPLRVRQAERERGRWKELSGKANAELAVAIEMFSELQELARAALAWRGVDSAHAHDALVRAIDDAEDTLRRLAGEP